MKKQYIFLIMIFITLYIIWLIWNFKYKEYKINSNIEYIRTLNKEIEIKIKNTNEMIEYKTSSAYKNKVLKEQQWFKNKAETVIYLTSEDKYNKFTQDLTEYKDEIDKITSEQEININTKEMSIYEKWIYFLFKKDLDL